MKRSILFAGTAILAACASSPANIGGLAGEPVDFFAQAPDAPAEWTASGVAGKAPKGDWLSQFNDPVMMSLVAEALENNPTLKSRAATMRAAEAATRSARSAGRPGLSASVTAGGNSVGVETPTGTTRTESEIYGVGLDASWELDLWDRIGASVNAAEADYAASEADLSAAELSLAAQTAIAWINLNEAIAQERVAELTYDARDRVRLLTERRFQRGLVIGVFARKLNSRKRCFVRTPINRRQSFPVFVLGMALVSVMGQEIWNVSIVLAVLFVPVFARLIRAEALSLRDRPFVAAARCSGATDGQIMFRHILPNALTPAIVQISISLGMAILLTAGLSFIGAGVRMPTPEWGLMVSVGSQQMILGVWWVALFPGLAIIFSVLSFSLLADGLREYVDPRRERL